MGQNYIERCVFFTKELNGTRMTRIERIFADQIRFYPQHPCHQRAITTLQVRVGNIMFL